MAARRETLVRKSWKEGDLEKIGKLPSYTCMSNVPYFQCLYRDKTIKRRTFL